MLDIKEKYQSQGYVEIATDSGTGSTILINNNLDRVVKINQDTAYNEFIEFSRSHTLKRTPTIYEYTKHGEPPYEGNSGFTLVEMEKLYKLNSQESAEYEKWIQNYWECKRNSKLPSDDFGLLEIIEKLLEHAIAHNIGIDLNKSTNIMKRKSGEYVVTDPFN